MKSAPSDRLREAREKAGFAGPAAAARRYGWNADSYKSHENGFRGIRVEVAEKYAKVFRVSAAWILTGAPEGAPALTSQERNLLEKFSLLSAEGKLSVLALCDALIEQTAAKILPPRRA